MNSRESQGEKSERQDEVRRVGNKCAKGGREPDRAAENRPDSTRLVSRFMMFMMNNRDSSYLGLPEEQEGRRRHLVNNCWHHSSFALITAASDRWLPGVVRKLWRGGEGGG